MAQEPNRKRKPEPSEPFSQEPNAEPEPSSLLSCAETHKNPPLEEPPEPKTGTARTVLSPTVTEPNRTGATLFYGHPDFSERSVTSGAHPVLPFLVFWRKAGKTTKKTRMFYPYRTPKIPGKEGKNAEKNKEFLARSKIQKSKERKDRAGVAAHVRAGGAKSTGASALRGCWGLREHCYEIPKHPRRGPRRTLEELSGPLRLRVLGACAMTTKFLDNKIFTFKILLS